MPCPYCTPTPEFTARTITQNALAKAVITNIPIVPGHTLIMPQRCIPTLESLTPEEHTALFTLLTTLKEAQKKAYNAQGFNIAINEGPIAGQSIPHLHIHVLPRTPNDTGTHTYDPRQFLYRPGPRDISPEEDLTAQATHLRNHL